MAWGRVATLKVGVGDPGIEGNAVDLSDFHFSFDVRRSRVYQDNHAEFTIYNAPLEVRKQFLVAGATVVFGAGYADEGAVKLEGSASAPTIFWGYVCLATTKKEGADWVSKLSCKIAVGMKEPNTTKVTKNKKTQISTTKVVSGAIAAVDRVFLELNYAPKTSYKTILSDICDQLALVLIQGNLADNIKAPNGFKDQGSVTGILARIRSVLEDNGISMFEEANDGIILFKLGEKPTAKQTLEAVWLSFDSGLLGLEEMESEIITPSAAERSAWNLPPTDKQLTLKKIRFSSLLNPEIKPNVGVLIDTPTLRETYILDAVEYRGDNFGGEFNLVGQGVG